MRMVTMRRAIGHSTEARSAVTHSALRSLACLVADGSVGRHTYAVCCDVQGRWRSVGRDAPLRRGRRRVRPWRTARPRQRHRRHRLPVAAVRTGRELHGAHSTACDGILPTPRLGRGPQARQV